jgi:hypothetical protein
MLQRLPLMLAALWWGSATAVGAWVVPLLFQHLGAPAVAGAMAARLFAAQTWVALLCGLVMLWGLRRLGVSAVDREVRHPGLPGDVSEAASRSSVYQGLEVWILGGMLAAAVMQWGVSPRIQAREQLALWHSMGSVLYALQWLAAGVTLWRLGRVSPANAS